VEGWVTTADHIGLDAAFEFEGKQVHLKQLYRKVVFMGNGKKKNKPS
jgi:hypothetical protein